MYKAIVIEDERLIRSYISNFINDCIEGFYVIESFMDGQDALDYLQTNQVDLIISDIRMLEVSGIEVAKYVCEHELQTKVILLSGYQSFAYAQEAINYNVSSYLTKPVDQVELQKVMEKIKCQLDKENTEKEESVIVETIEGEGSRIDGKIMIERALSYINQPFSKIYLYHNFD